MNISFRQLQAFLHVARLGSFTRASEQMYITQAGLSIMMRELESQLNCRLFDRTTRIVCLTPAGEKFLPIASRMVGDLEIAAEQLGEHTAKLRHTLHVGVTPLISSNVLPAVCRAFRLEHPEVKIRVVDTDHSQIQSMVESGEIDFGLGAFFKLAVGLTLTTLFDYQLMWVAPSEAGDGAAYDLSRGRVPWSALEEAVLVGVPMDNNIQRVIEDHLGKIARAHEERLTFNNFETLIAMVSAGVGTAIVPSYSIESCRRHGVQTAILTDPEVSLSFYQLTKKGRAPAHMAGAFVEAFIASVRRVSGSLVK